MHRLLRRQLRKYLGVEDDVPDALRRFIGAVDAAYADFDSDRAMLERSLELGLKELSDARDEATAARRRLTDALESISEGFFLYNSDDRMVLCNSRYRELFSGMADVYRPGLEFEQMIRTVVERGIVVEAMQRPQEWIARNSLSIATLVDGFCFRVMGGGSRSANARRRTAAPWAYSRT